MTEFHASDTVGGYRLEARLGGGGFGTVWRARRAGDSMLVALKLLPDNAGTDDGHLRADVELLAASAASASPHVVRVLDGGVDPVPFVVMEFIYGISLAEELRQRQKLPQQEVIDIGLAIADALKALNAAGIVHRDVKPSNVMIDRNGVVKLTDFGIAKIAGFDAVTLTGQLPLSIAYAAPEVWEGRAEHRSDLYALSIVLYQCLSGALPFRGAYAELFYQHRSKEPDLSAIPPDTAPTLVELIQRCLEKTPRDRPLDAEVCIEMLQRASSEMSTTRIAVQPPQVREPERFGPWAKEEPVAGLPWAWYCRHETTGGEAIVEIYFAETVAFGEALRRAVVSNDAMAARGSECLFGSNRLILRPTEAWPNPPPGAFQFWVARESRSLTRPPSQISPRLALRVVESLLGLIEAADEEGLPLNLDPRELTVLPEGELYLTHPGFPSPGRDEPEQQALTYLRSLPLSREVKASLNRVNSLDDARRSLAMLTSVRDLTSPRNVAPGADFSTRDTYVESESRFEPGPSRDTTPARSPKKPPWLALAAGAGVIALVAVVAAVLLTGGHKTKDLAATIPPTTVPTIIPTPPNPIVAACLALPEPSPISVAEQTCADSGTYVFDPTCPRGQVCNRKPSSDKVAWGTNDRSVAFTDPSGSLAVAREDGSEPLILPNTVRAVQPAWSPDGRYLAYLTVSTIDVTPTPLPSPGTTPQPGPPILPGPYYSTQLQVIEVDRPANHGIVVATNSSPATPSYLQQYAAWPQWSPDGKTLYFLSIPAGPGTPVIQSLSLPTRGNDIDFGQLRSGLLSMETSLPSKLQTISLTGADFGQPNAYLGRFAVQTNGELDIQLCEGDRTRPSCGLARWTGKASTALMAPIVANRVVEPPDAGSDGFYAYVKEPSGVGDVLKIAPDVPAATLDIRLTPGSDAGGIAWFSASPQLAVTRHGDALLASTGSGQLSGIRLTDGAASPWRAGSSPIWYVSAPRPDTTAPPPPAQAYSTPSPEPSPTVTVTPRPTPNAVVRTMSLNLTIRRLNNVLIASTVVVLAGSDECARGVTDGLGRVVLTLPGNGAATSCSLPDTRYRFVVDGTLVEQTVAYNPQSVSSFDITVP